MGEMVPRRELLYDRQGSELVEAIQGSKPRAFEASVYLAPVSRDDIQILHRTVKPEDSGKYRLIRRRLVQETYQSLGSLIFAIINTDALFRMRRSKGTLENAFRQCQDKIKKGEWFDYSFHDLPFEEDYATVMRKREEIVSGAEAIIEKLACFPTDFDASKKMSETAKEYDEFAVTEAQRIAHRMNMSTEDLLSLYARYGANYNGMQFESFEHLASQLFGGHFWRGPIPRQEDLDSGKAYDFLHMRLRTNSGVLVKMSNAHELPPKIRELFEFPDCKIAGSVQPIEVRVTSEGRGTRHAAFLRGVFNRLKKAYDYMRLDFMGKEVLLFCPKRSLLSGAIGELPG
jgi:hypothetical protein